MKKLFVVALLFLVACGQNKEEATQKKQRESTLPFEVPTLRLNITTDFVTGQFDYTQRNDFVKVDSEYTDGTTYLHKKTYQAFKAMADSAKKDGITLTIVSGTRNFNHQKAIWESKWSASDSTTALGKAKGILEYSSMPMTSRHHWGTEVDLNNLNNSYFESGAGQKVYKWLKNHANSFGFYQPYTAKSINGRTGYNKEMWHWSYIPLASRYLAYYNKHITNKDISGFKGAKTAQKIDMVKYYVNGISKKIKQISKQLLQKQ